MNGENLLMFADSEHDANMLYAVGAFVPDPFIYLRIGKRAAIVMSDLEIDRARAKADRCRVLSLSRYQKLLKEKGVRKPGFADVIKAILRERGARSVLVPHNFPYGMAEELKRKGIG